MNGRTARRWRITDRVGVWLVGTIIVVGFLALLLWRSVFVPIPPGHVGVLYSLLVGGTRVGFIWPEGLAVKLPWDRLYVYDVRIQSRTRVAEGLSREGMPVQAEFTLLFRADRGRAPRLHKEIGPEYIERVVEPVAVGNVREYIASHDSHELYSVDYAEMQRKIVQGIRALLDPKHVEVVDFLVVRIGLPPAVVQAIESKLTHEQFAAAYAFRLEAEQLEARRLRIKADGLRDYYATVNSALTPPLLTWRGVEATTELAQSPNSKLVIIGSGRDQLPLILGGEIGRLPEVKPPAAVPPPGAGAPERPGVPRIFPPGGAQPAPGAGAQAIPARPGAPGQGTPGQSTAGPTTPGQATPGEPAPAQPPPRR